MRLLHLCWLPAWERLCEKVRSQHPEHALLLDAYLLRRHCSHSSASFWLSVKKRLRDHLFLSSHAVL